MFQRIKRILFLSIVVSFLAVVGCEEPAAPLEPGPILSVYLTFQQENTSDNITINYFHVGHSEKSSVYYDTVSRDGYKDEYKFSKEATFRKIETLDRTYHSLELTDLSPRETYYFVVGNEETGYTKEYKFKTLPDDDTPIRFIQGGDMGPKPEIYTIAKSSLEYEPQVILIGGDIAYADGKLKNLNAWETWFDVMNRTMVTPQGFLTPLILAIGNHEIKSVVYVPTLKAPFFLGLFPQNGDQSYFLRRLGAHTVLFVLDTGHLVPQSGTQAEWLEENMAANVDVPNKLALYHIPMFPSHRMFYGPGSMFGRRYWMPIFDKYGLSMAFENHDHAMKRTFRLKGGEVVNTGGTIYVGDGCWGKSTRDVKQRWYLEKAQSVKHLWYGELSPGLIHIEANGMDNTQYDNYDLITDEKLNEEFNEVASF